MSLILLSPRYPFAYSVVVLPVSVVRWITFQNQTCGTGSNGHTSVPAAATFATVFLHDLFGFVNVLLLLTTRQTLLLFEKPEGMGEGEEGGRAVNGEAQPASAQRRAGEYHAEERHAANGGRPGTGPDPFEEQMRNMNGHGREATGGSGRESRAAERRGRGRAPAVSPSGSRRSRSEPWRDDGERDRHPYVE